MLQNCHNTNALEAIIVSLTIKVCAIQYYLRVIFRH